MNILRAILRILPAIFEGLRRYYDARQAKAIQAEIVRERERQQARAEAMDALARADQARAEADALRAKIKALEGE